MRLAVPYYGSIIHPSYGLSRLFYFGLIDRETLSMVDLEIAIWNPEDTTDLAAWLAAHQVAGVLATDAPDPYVGELRSKGIWVEGKQQGDSRELINRWLYRQALNDGKPGFSFQTG